MNELKRFQQKIKDHGPESITVGDIAVLQAWTRQCNATTKWLCIAIVVINALTLCVLLAL